LKKQPDEIPRSQPVVKGFLPKNGHFSCPGAGRKTLSGAAQEIRNTRFEPVQKALFPYKFVMILSARTRDLIVTHPSEVSFGHF
jgi:hypothetical protein